MHEPLPPAPRRDRGERFFYNGLMPSATDEFYRIRKLPPYVFAVVNEMKAKLRAAQQVVVDLGMGNPDGATPRAIVSINAKDAGAHLQFGAVGF